MRSIMHERIFTLNASFLHSFSLQALHAAVSCTAPGSTIHEASLLKAVRTAYNIFLLSRKSTLQAMALGALRQMIDHVYGRAVVPREMRGDFAAYMAAAASNSNVISSMGNVPAVRVESMATDVPVVVPAVEDSPTTSKVPSASMIVAELVDEIVVRATTPVEDLADQEESAKKKDDSKKEEQIATAEPAIAKAPTLSPMDVHILDAFLIFRALCRLSIKPVPEGSSETKTYALKSKVLSLHLLNHIVQNHFTVVSSVYPLPAGALHEPKPASAANATGSTTAPSPDENKTPVVGNFVEAVKSLLCFSLSRNAVSLVPEVLDRSLEIFIKLVVGMRHHLKVFARIGVLLE